jgi:hypothetical protein
MSGRKLIVDWKHTADELYARYKQVRRRWTARGVKLRQRVERRYVWR